MISYNTERLKELGHLNDNDLKIIKHLNAINNIFKNKDTNISHLFAFAGTMHICIDLDGEEWCFDSYINIPCDGGDPNREELRQEYELSEYLDRITDYD